MAYHSKYRVRGRKQENRERKRQDQKNEKQSPVLNSPQLALQDQALSQVQLPGKTTRHQGKGPPRGIRPKRYSTTYIVTLVPFWAST